MRVRVRLRDIAREVGVSEATVSRALSPTRRLLVRNETRARILRVAKALGYLPNFYAQALASGKTSLVAVVVAYTEDYLMNVKALKLHEALLAAGLQAQMIPAQSLQELESADRIAAALLRTNPLAVVIRPLATSWPLGLLEELCGALHHHGVHALLVDHHELPSPDVPADAITTDRVGASVTAVSHLLESGHRHIGLLASRDRVFGRIQGYDQALDEYGIRERYFQPLEPYVEGSTGPVYSLAYVEAGYRAVQDLLTRHPEITALYCSSDLVAVGAMKGVFDRGQRVPQDVAIVGFNDEPWCSHLLVPLSSVAQPVAELARRAMAMLKERIEGCGKPWRRELLPMRLVVRESSLRPNSDCESNSA